MCEERDEKENDQNWMGKRNIILEERYNRQRELDKQKRRQEES